MAKELIENKRVDQQVFSSWFHLPFKSLLYVLKHLEQEKHWRVCCVSRYVISCRFFYM